jgi:hypothetical protein
MTTTRTLATVLTLVLAAVGCSGSGCLEITETVPLLEAPYPLDYPSTSPRPNRKLRDVEKGRFDLLDRVLGKDYLVYRVRLTDGTVGYLVSGNAVRECQ